MKEFCPTIIEENYEKLKILNDSKTKNKNNILNLKLFHRGKF